MANYNFSSTTYSWVELNGKPGATLILGSGDNFANPINGKLSSSYTFNFYGTTYNGDNQLYASFSGLLSFVRGFAGPANSTPGYHGDMIHNPWINVASTQTATAAICPLWNTYSAPNPPNTAVWAWLDTTNNLLYVEWTGVYMIEPPFSSGSPGTVSFAFQVILQLNTGSTPGNITFQYQAIDPAYAPSDMSVGVTTGGTDTPTVPATNYAVSSYNAANPLVGNGLAILASYGVGPPILVSLTDTVTFTARHDVPGPDANLSLTDTVTFTPAFTTTEFNVSLADTVTFTDTPSFLPIVYFFTLQDTLTFTTIQDSPEKNVTLIDTIQFGAKVRLDTTDLAGGRYRY